MTEIVVKKSETKTCWPENKTPSYKVYDNHKTKDRRVLVNIYKAANHEALNKFMKEKGIWQ